MGLHIIEIKKHGVCFVGDIHGNFESIKFLTTNTGLSGVTYVFVGDCGFGFNNDSYYANTFDKIRKSISKFDNEYIFIRGNHDSKEYFDNKKIKLKYFKTVPDYTVIKTPEHNILCVGGATSIDRSYRINQEKHNLLKYQILHRCSEEDARLKCPRLYWSDELPYYDENALNELKEKDINIYIVCTHTCPSFADPISKEGIKMWLKEDKTLEADIGLERNVMDRIYEKLKSDGHKIDKWIYGHYHRHNYEFIESTHFIMLDMCRNGICDTYPVLY